MQLIPYAPDRWAALKSLALKSVRSPHSRRAYGAALDEWRNWYEGAPEPRPPFFSKASVQAFRVHLEERRLAAASINLRLSAVRRLAVEAGDNGLVAPELVAGISHVKGVGQLGTRSGTWLTRDQAERLIQAPEPDTLTGKRDRAILGLLIGCGLRREEAARLRTSDVQQREGRWVIVDIHGKGNRIRSVAMPPWAKALIDVWVQAAGFTEGRIFRGLNKGGRLAGGQLGGNAIWRCVQKYARCIQVMNLAPHDLRRTYAKLAHTGKAAIEQIQISLGHGSIVTTERYLGVKQDLSDAPCDHLGLSVAVETEAR